MDGVTAIANILRMEGVEFIGCVPYQPLLEAAAIAGIRPIIFRQEGTGIHMVDGFSRVTNGKRTGVFMMQNGPGAENGFGRPSQDPSGDQARFTALVARRIVEGAGHDLPAHRPDTVSAALLELLL